MTRIEMKQKIAELKELKNMKAELEDMISSIEDELKAEMTERDTEEVVIDEFKITWKSVMSRRLDQTALKAARPEIVAQFTKESSCRRFVVS